MRSLRNFIDDTPDITYQYDNLGRQTQVTDAVGTTTFTYNAYGDLTTESVSGLYSRTLIHYFDSYGRDLGYTIDGTRTLVKEYDGETGRLSRAQIGGGWFAWDYLEGSNLKSKLTYPNGATASWMYEPTRDLLTSVTNRANGAVISAYDYTNDIVGRRTVIGKSGTMMDENEVQPYTYNIRNEQTSGQGYSYDYDDIGNRVEAEGRDYTANELNQYTAIDTFTPEYDLDGNQTKILTSTGEWVVEYNAENRPIRWTQGNIEIEMAYDRMGRRISYHETRNGANYINAKFVYNGYLCIQRLYGSSNGVYQSFVWDPTEPVATRPLCMQVPSWGATTFYMHDGNKNVSDLIYYALANGIAAHYDYAPFGAMTRTARDTRMTQHTFIAENPFRFSSEYHDNSLGLVYYNYRHYNPKNGRWCGRDMLEEVGGGNLYSFLQNNLTFFDWLGCVKSSYKITSYIVTDGDEFQVPNMVPGTRGYFAAVYDIVAMYNPAPNLYHKRDEKGCYLYVINATMLRFQVEDRHVELFIPQFNSENVKGLPDFKIKNIKRVIDDIVRHEYSHLRQYEEWKIKIGKIAFNLPEIIACSMDEAESRFKNQEEEKKKSLPVFDSYDTTHRDLGSYISNLFDVIEYSAPIEYSYD